MTDLQWGLAMTALGMGTVFALLLALMLLLIVIGRFDRGRTAPVEDRPGAEPSSLASSPAPTPSPVDDDAAGAPTVRVLADGLTEHELAAITVAVLLHRDIRRAQAAPEARVHRPGSQLYANRWVSVGRAQQTQSRLTRRH